MYQKYAIKKALKGMTRKERTRGVQDIMKGIKGPLTARKLKKELREEGLSRMATRRILGAVKSSAMPGGAATTPQKTATTPQGMTAPPQKPIEEKIGKEGWRIGGHIKPKEPETSKSKKIKTEEWIKELGRMGIRSKEDEKNTRSGFKPGNLYSPNFDKLKSPKKFESTREQPTPETLKTQEMASNPQGKSFRNETIKTINELEKEERMEESKIDQLLKEEMSKKDISPSEDKNADLETDTPTPGDDETF